MISVLDSNKLGPGLHVQVHQSKNEDNEMGLCVAGVTEGPKGP